MSSIRNYSRLKCSEEVYRKKRQAVHNFGVETVQDLRGKWARDGSPGTENRWPILSLSVTFSFS